VDYYISDKHSIGIGGRWNKRISDRIVSSKTIISDANISNVLFSENVFDRVSKNFNFNPYYEYKTDSEKLVIDFNYIDYENNSMNTLSDVAGSTITYQDKRYVQNGKYNIKTYKADYSKTYSDNLKLSFGSKYAAVNTDNDLQSFTENNTNGFDADVDNSSQFLIDESIFAIYSKVNATFGKWSFSGGLRYENSNTNGTSHFIKNGVPTIETKKRPINKIFPSASLSREISESFRRKCIV